MRAPLALMRRVPGVLVASGLALGVGLGAAACGTGGISKSGDASRGKQLFAQKCGACHTLADAQTAGTIGPNLDSAFAPDRAQGFKQSSIQQVVAGQIRFPITSPPTCQAGTSGPNCPRTQGMPANLVRGRDLQDVAAYVASVAGKPVQGGGGGGRITSTGGKEIFAAAGCGGCHTLKDAGTSGTVGPNLDERKPPKSLVAERVTNGKGAMPSFKGRLTAQQIQAVADYVSSVAGK